MVNHSKNDTSMPRGYIRLEGASNYDKWVFTCKAQWTRDGILYVLTNKDPRPQAGDQASEEPQIPLPQKEIDDMELAYKQEVYNRVIASNSAAEAQARQNGVAVAFDALQVPDYSQMPDFSDRTRPETASEKRKRISKFEDDMAKIWDPQT